VKLRLDQGLPRTAATGLAALGWDVVHVGEIGMSAAADQEILGRALADGRAVVTLDADFHTNLALENAAGPSVIRIRIEGLRGFFQRQAVCGWSPSRRANALSVSPLASQDSNRARHSASATPAGLRPIETVRCRTHAAAARVGSTGRIRASGDLSQGDQKARQLLAGSPERRALGDYLGVSFITAPASALLVAHGVTNSFVQYTLVESTAIPAGTSPEASVVGVPPSRATLITVPPPTVVQ
jgi:predicted nuclease of predicted toxin-antitoxin system